ncbi:HCNGP-like protein-domain-containing protein [Sporodiniella umbellata]|nr:HCNGP-like protein-domain-containing protein [Sporodiniella umbellata]
MSSIAGLVNYSDGELSSGDEEVQSVNSTFQPAPSVSVPVVQVPTTQALPMPEPNLHILTKKTRLMNVLAPKPIEGIDNWGIPNEPTQACDPERAEKIAHFLSLKASGHRLNNHLAHSKAFRNPRIYAKLVEFTNVDELGSNMDPKEFDPKGFEPSFYIDGILETQKELAEGKTKRSAVNFVKSELTQEQSEVMAKAMANAAKIASRITTESQK